MLSCSYIGETLGTGWSCKTVELKRMQLSLRMLYQVAVYKPYLPEIFLILDEKVSSTSYDYKHTSNGIASYLDGS